MSADSDSVVTLITLDEIKLWGKLQLQRFLRERGLKITGKKEELQALVYGASVLHVPVLPTKEEELAEKAAAYRTCLAVDGQNLPDPLSLPSGWRKEKWAMTDWPPTMHSDIAVYLLGITEAAEFTKRLLSDYKEGKAYSYFDSGWLQELLYHPIEETSNFCFLKAEVMPSMRVHHVPHDTWVCIEKESGKVFSAYCTCFAGLGGTCNHVAAILFKLDFAWRQGFTNKPCTSKECQWNKYTGSSKELLQPKPVDDMEWRKPHFSKGSGHQGINPVSRRLFNPLPASAGRPSLNSLVNALLPSCHQACVLHYVSTPSPPVYPPCADFSVGRFEEVGTSEAFPKPLEHLAAEAATVDGLLKDLPVYSEAQVSALVEHTAGQGKNINWLLHRIGRVTATSAHHVMTRVRTMRKKPETDFKSLVGRIMGYSAPPNTLPALKYGRRNEEAARIRYTQVMKGEGHKDLRVRETGLWVCQEHVYIGASPDGLVQCSCCGDGLVEIKCPLSIAQDCPQDVPLEYMVKSPLGELRLKDTHPYFTQMQVQMGVTGCKWCDFFIFTQVGFHKERVAFEPCVWEEVRMAAEIVFKKHVAPEMVERKMREQVTTPAANLSNPTSSLSTDSGTGPVTGLPTKRGKKGKSNRKVNKSSAKPVYLCDDCGKQCKDDSQIDDDCDNSVSCDKCQQWFHQGCAGFDPDTPDDTLWLCRKCTV